MARPFFVPSGGTQGRQMMYRLRLLSKATAVPKKVARVGIWATNILRDIWTRRVAASSRTSVTLSSRRTMPMARPSMVPATLSIVVTVGFLGVLIGMMKGWLTTDSSDALLLMLGSLGTAWTGVMAFWFGTTPDDKLVDPGFPRRFVPRAFE